MRVESSKITGVRVSIEARSRGLNLNNPQLPYSYSYIVLFGYCSTLYCLFNNSLVQLNQMNTECLLSRCRQMEKTNQAIMLSMSPLAKNTQCLIDSDISNSET